MESGYFKLKYGYFKLKYQSKAGQQEKCTVCWIWLTIALSTLRNTAHRLILNTFFNFLSSAFPMRRKRVTATPHARGSVRPAGWLMSSLSQEAASETIASPQHLTLSFVIVGLAALKRRTRADSAASGCLGKHSASCVCSGQMAHSVYRVWASGSLMSVLQTEQPSVAGKVWCRQTSHISGIFIA